MASLEFRIVRHATGKAQLGESPFWDPNSNDLWWVDITGKQILRADTLTGDCRSWATPEYPGFVVLTAAGYPAVGMQSGIFVFEPEKCAFEKIVPFDQSDCRFNDAAVDRDGRLWVTTMALDAQAGQGAVHAVTQDLNLETLAGGLAIPNGLAPDLARGRLFYSDSHPAIQTIWIHPLKSSRKEAGEPLRFTTTKELAGRPDGAALDQRGYYWIAGVDGSELYVFDLHGELHTTVRVPFAAPTKLSFSGTAVRSIAVTSKEDAEDGGYIALADIPAHMPSGIAQPCWSPGVS